MYHFNRRTAEPLEPYPAPGYDKTTSRCQTTPSIWALRGYQPVIPSVPCPIRNGFSTQNHSLNMADFSPCQICRSNSQAIYLPLHYNDQYHTDLRTTFAHPRYYLGGDRPSQTNHFT